MKYEVIKRFRDKNTKKYYNIDSVYEADNKRAADLKKGGYLGKEIESSINDLLNQNVTNVKAAVTEKFTNQQLIELLEQEKVGENRKGVVEHIESLLKDEDDESRKTK